MAEDLAGQGAVAGAPPAARSLVTQALLMVVGIALGIGLLYIVIVLARGGGVSVFYSFLAALSVLGAGAGLWAGYIATYRLVTVMAQSLGGAGATIVFISSFVLPDSPARPISIVISVVAGFASALPRIAEAATAAAMLVASLFVFEATRRGYLGVWTIAAAPTLMAAASLLLGNAFAALSGRPSSTNESDPGGLAPLQ